MKKTFLIILILPMITFSQYSKKELKKINNLELKINNRGLDLTAAFVPFSYRIGYDESSDASAESNWEQALFSAGLKVGSYSSKSTVKDTENREVLLEEAYVFKGRYVFDVSKRGLIKILDLENDNQIVATVFYRYNKAFLYYRQQDYYKRDYVIKKLIELN